MSESVEPSKSRTPESSWAKPVGKLQVEGVPQGAINLNVNGRQLAGPLQGFGQMWQKTYWVRLSGVEVTPQDLIQTWKQHFPEFWPEGNRFYGSLTGIEPGQVAVLNLAAPAGMSLSTGIMVIYADDESFSFMTPQGHMFAGMITFSSYEDGGTTVAQIQALVRASDPIYEIGCRVGVVHKNEDNFWHGTLQNLAANYGVKGQVQQQTTCVDKKVVWSRAGNIWHNAAIRTTLDAPLRTGRRLVGR
jgi:hypothetical protein